MTSLTDWQTQGLLRFEARGAVPSALSALGRYRGCHAHPMTVPPCSRTQDVIELVLRPQWFVRCNELAQEASEAVQSGRLNLMPQLHRRAWHSWLDNITDWCVSWQVCWGHRIPVYHITAADGWEVWVAAGSEEDARRKAVEKEGIPLASMSTQQEEDVLDTWFSSGLFPFASLGWPGQGRGETMPDLARFYPTTLVKMGHNILFFWVAQMVMPGLNPMGRLPFETVLLHGLQGDGGGHKMSKSWGSVMSSVGMSLEVLCKRVEGSLNTEEVLTSIRRNFPTGILECVLECGADALWFTLCSTNFNKLSPKTRSAGGCVLHWQLARALTGKACELHTPSSSLKALSSLFPVLGALPPPTTTTTTTAAITYEGETL